MNKKVLLTGGGTAGHVTPNIALIPKLKEMGFDICYMGSYEGIEKKLIKDLNIPYYGISSGKLRRYMSIENFKDPFKVIKGYFEAKSILKEIKPDVIFSKGGFVTVPVVRAAAALGIPVIAHESDITPGLANRLSFPSAKKVCCNFPETVSSLPEGKAVLTGSPIRKELFEGSREKGLSFTGLKGDKPVIMVTGGSLGAVAVNRAVREALPKLLEKFDVVHLCGKGKTDGSLDGTEGYRQYEFIKDEMADIFAMADIVISRAGANAICEIRALAIPNLLIPLSAKASRGDQVLNARSFEKQGFSYVIEEEDLTTESLIAGIDCLWENRDKYKNAMASSEQNDAIGIITGLINDYA